MFVTVTTPFWLYLLGQPLIYATYGKTYPNAAFPWMLLFIFELIYIVPAFAFYAIYYHFPKAGRILSLVLRPVGTLLILVSASLALIFNDWVYPLVNTWQYVFVPALLPVCGYILGIIATILCRFSMRIVITNSIETGIQNVTFAVLMCEAILPKPDGDMAIMIGVMYCCTMFTTFVLAFPLMLITAKVRHHLPRMYAVDERATRMEVFDISGSANSASQPTTPGSEASSTISETVNEKIIASVINGIFSELPIFTVNASSTAIGFDASSKQKIDLSDEAFEDVVKY